MLYCPKCYFYIIIIFSSIYFIIIYNNSNNTIIKRINDSRKRIGPHNKEIISIIYGSLLGDGHAEYRKQSNGTRISFSQESNHYKYLIWLHNIVSSHGYCNTTVPKIQSRIGDKGKIRYIIRFHTYTYSSFNEIHNKWYVNNKKTVPKDIKEFLTPIALAIWTINDGSRSGNSIKWSTNNFSYEDCMYLSYVIYDLYKIKTSVISAGKKDQYVIYVIKESIPILRDLIKDYIISEILYKLNY
uniref:putative LAGLIDADG homing endonuclease n=1 Tax=Malassezia cuniculi TaxID=948313 RepID=UPI003001A00A|nr:putative LAGLIDADG homing endonuclease [Malassezia cuniculi]